MKLLPKKSLLILAISAFITCNSFAQLITSTMTPAQLVQNVLLGNGIVATNITYVGDPNAIGFFKGNTNLGLDSGIVMTTGTIFAPDGPQGPNNSSGAGTDNLQPGDAYLDQIIAPAQTYNAAVLEFDFIPSSDTLKFRYVFGTEEYMEYVGGGFADAFAFVLTGVNVAFPATNIALIPGTQTPVTALNVNANVNSQYYFDNENPPGTTIQYDGFTVVLTAKQKVECGKIYHIKLVLADALDGAVDAGVFLEAGSFASSNPIDLSFDIAFGNNDSTLYEGCSSASIDFVRGQNFLNQLDTVYYTISGTATNGSDYVSIPDSLFFNIGDDTLTMNIIPVLDQISEGLESVTLTIIPKGPCTQAPPVTTTIYITNVDPITLTLSDDKTICTPDESANLLASATGGLGTLHYTWDNGLGTNPSATVSPSVKTMYKVTVSDSCDNMQSDSVIITIICDLVIPNIFTPNGDNTNDLFIIANLEYYPNSHLQIFNRWGKKIYDSPDYQNDWNGSNYSDVVYYFILDSNSKLYTNFITILR